MAEGPYLLGIDFGTGGARVGIFDREGTPFAFHAGEWETRYPRSGWAEQDPNEWWSCLVEASRGAMEKSGLSPEEIAGISVDATASTVLAIDDNDRPLRPAIMWMDVRASDQADRIAGTSDEALKYNGYGPVSAEWGLPKAMWIMEREPEVYEKARHICDCGDWLINRLTGEWAGSINIASSKYYYDRDNGGYPESLYEAVGASDLLDKYPSNILDLGVVVGERGGGRGVRRRRRRRARAQGRHARGARGHRRLRRRFRARGGRARQDGAHHRLLARHDRAVRPARP